MRTLMSPVLGAALLLAASPAARASGFLLNDHGASATGRADAVAATVTDGSAIFYNPAGVGAAEGTHIYVGASLILPDASFTDKSTGQTTNMQENYAVTPNAYVHTSLGKYFRAGIGFNTPYGSTVKWPASSPGADVLREVTLQTFFISPVLGVKLDRWIPGLALGGGINVVPSTVELRRDIWFGSDTGTAHLGGSAFGVGGQVGVQYRPPAVPGLAVGAAWRSQVNLDFSGKGNFDAPAPYRGSLPPDGNISTTIDLPQQVQGGVAYQLGPVQLEGDVQWVNWAVVKSIDINLPDGMTSVNQRNYKNTVTYRAGVESTLVPWLTLRAGYAYDPTPIPRRYLTVSLPDINRNVASLGATVRLPRGSHVDLGILGVLPGSRSTSDQQYMPELKGTYDVAALVVALNYGMTME